MFEDSMRQKLTNMEKEEYKTSVLEYDDVRESMMCEREVGREEGREEGRVEGREEGREERHASSSATCSPRGSTRPWWRKSPS